MWWSRRSINATPAKTAADDQDTLAFRPRRVDDDCCLVMSAVRQAKLWVRFRNRLRFEIH